MEGEKVSESQEINICDKEEGEEYELFNAQGNMMGVSGTCTIYVGPEGCQKPRLVRCLATPSLEEEETLCVGRK